MDGLLAGLAAGVKGAESGVEKALARKLQQEEMAQKKLLQDAQIGKLGAETEKDRAYANFLKGGKGGAGEIKLTEAELKEKRLQEQLAHEQENIQELSKGYDLNTPRGFIEGMLPRFMQSAERQKLEDAKKNYGLLKTFELSGAQAPASERADIMALNTPQFGDAPEVVASKLKRQEVGAAAGVVRGQKPKDTKLIDRNTAIKVSPQDVQAGQKPVPKGASIPSGEVIVTPDGSSWIKTPSGTLKQVK
jgi:hypothetical protein